MKRSASITSAAESEEKTKKAANPNPESFRGQAPEKLQTPTFKSNCRSCRESDGGFMTFETTMAPRYLLRRGSRLLFFFERQKVSFFAAGNKTFRDGLQLLPAGANLLRFFARDLVVRRRGRNHRQQVGKF